MRAFLVVVAGACAALVGAVNPGVFKECNDSSLCRRFRRTAEHVEANAPFISPYSVDDLNAAALSDGVLHTTVRSALHPSVRFGLNVTFFDDGSARLRMDEASPTYNDLRHYDGAATWAIKRLPNIAGDASLSTHDKGVTVSWAGNQFILEYEPLRLSFVRDGVVQAVVNDRSLLHMEHFRSKPENFPLEGEDATSKRDAALREAYAAQPTRRTAPSDKTFDAWASYESDDGGEWSESWGGKEDTKPKGPEAVGIDVSFPGYETLYGLPEHASPLALRTTREPAPGEEDEPGRFSDPYRLMNTDVFEYHADSPMSLYGSAPILHAQSKGSAVSVLWLNAAETWVDLHKTKARPAPPPGHTDARATAVRDDGFLSGGTDKRTSHAHFVSESGVLDMFVFLGPSASDIMSQFTQLVGRTALPQYFALGYHQCRWNYVSSDDVLDVSARFDTNDMPVDVIWLDIEYSSEHMYGVWDRGNFPDPEALAGALDAQGRKLVIIIDPHLKKSDDYYLYKEARDRDLLVKTRSGSNYEGTCWSGLASWIDFFKPEVWRWWIEQHSLARKKLVGNARNLFFWNDMSEPAIFDGPELTSPKDVVHHGGWENRDVHNINGLIMHNLTAAGTVERELGTKDKDGRPGVRRRPFVLTRSWWLGSQVSAATWTGDNMGTWEHFAVSVPMILSNGLGGMSFCGADIGGFFGNPDKELLVRWYQAGIFEPFFRAHAHSDTKRREPYLLDDEARASVRRILQLRYELLPVWYTAFWYSGQTGMPVLRPQHLVFPHDRKGFTVGDQYYLDGLLVKPAVSQGVDHVEMYLAERGPYYHYTTGHVYKGVPSGTNVRVPAPMDHNVPLLQRAGTILPVHTRARRAAELQANDPYTLRVALPKTGPKHAHGTLYTDDGQTYAHEDGAFIARQFELAEDGKSLRLTSRALSLGGVASASSYASKHTARVERVIIYGLDKEPKKVVVHDGQAREVKFSYTPSQKRRATSDDSSELVSASLVIHNPSTRISADWDIEIVV
ncbi:glucan 1,3-alpha-glucosidase [Malassezia cuniculi]|uniref:Glucosidase II subunit alpha n=1 Tax=Malassezia cuniculi TaxID=948313 RepID=A0AAF0EQY0_9BASI|nr:glucan 1,3-alpha-glucosidase [Malassezia cuniculi]